MTSFLKTAPLVLLLFHVANAQPTPEPSPSPSPSESASESSGAELSPTETTPPPRPQNFWAHASADFSRPGVLGSTSLQIKPVLGLDYFLNPFANRTSATGNWSIGGYLSSYNLPLGVTVSRVEYGVEVGYWLFERNLGLLARTGITSTSVDGYDSSSDDSHYGFETKYRIPLGKQFDIFFSVGWTHYNSATLTHDTGVPVTNSDLENTLCTIFTLGLANGCGNVIQTLTVPAINALDAGVGLGYQF